MLAPEVVDRIRCLLSERRLSQRAIARLVGVNRGTVNAIASRRGHYDERSQWHRRREEVLRPTANRDGALDVADWSRCLVWHVASARSSGSGDSKPQPRSERSSPVSPRRDRAASRSNVSQW